MRKITVKKADLNTKAGKFLTARYKGLNKKQSAEVVGIDPRDVTRLENTQLYQAIEKKYFRDELLQQIGMTEIATELRKIIVQDEDRGAKNTAIKLALDKLEPIAVSDNEMNDRVMVILK